MNASIDPTAFQVIPVLDLRGGVAVHARGGRRDQYREVDGRFGLGRDPVALAGRLRRAVGSPLLYLADLDAIEGTGSHRDIIEALASNGARPLVDLGIRTGDELPDVGARSQFAFVAGTETLRGVSALSRLIDRQGPGRIVPSLDLRDGRLIRPDEADWPDPEPSAIADAAAALGVGRLIVLDLGRVGARRGPGGLELVARIKSRHPGMAVLAGGGVSSAADLRRLRDAGASGALVATVLHDGALDPAALAEFLPGA